MWKGVILADILSKDSQCISIISAIGRYYWFFLFIRVGRFNVLIAKLLPKYIYQN